MTSDIEDLERLLAVAASVRARLICPGCGNSDDENFEIYYKAEFRSPVGFDGPAKHLLPEYRYEEFVAELTSEPILSCFSCGHQFPVPLGWQIVARNKKSHQPGTTAIRTSRKESNDINPARHAERQS